MDYPRVRGRVGRAGRRVRCLHSLDVDRLRIRRRRVIRHRRLRLLRMSRLRNDRAPRVRIRTGAVAVGGVVAITMGVGGCSLRSLASLRFHLSLNRLRLSSQHPRLFLLQQRVPLRLRPDPHLHRPLRARTKLAEAPSALRRPQAQTPTQTPTQTRVRRPTRSHCMNSADASCASSFLRRSTVPWWMWRTRRMGWSFLNVC